MPHPEAPWCSTDADSWEPPLSDRGNIARSLFYMAIRYTGDVANEPALVLTDNTALINSASGYMGKLSTLLAWHQADPVDAAEQLRNDLVYSIYQTNRNPFVDHPEWVNLTFAPAQTNPPVLSIALATNGIVLSWLATNQSTRLEYATNRIGERIIETFSRHLSWHHVTIRLLNPDTDELVLIALNQPGMKSEDRGEIEHRFNSLIDRVGKGLSGWAVQTGQAIRTGNVLE